MKADKKILALLALNTLAAMPGEAAESKTDKLYNNIVKNIQTGKSNNKNFKLIEKSDINKFQKYYDNPEGISLTTNILSAYLWRNEYNIKRNVE